MIFGQFQIKKYKVIINMKNNFLSFLLTYCINIGAIFFTILNQPKLLIKTSIIKIKKMIIF